MTEPSKLYDQLVANPSPRSSTLRDFERLLEAFGWEHKRTKGSHRHYVHPMCPRC